MSAAENLKRWKESSRPRAWVESHNGEWDHADWLSLLEELQKTEYWPMEPAAVGQVLEALKQEYREQPGASVVRCPRCGGASQVPSQLTAKTARCPHCSTAFAIAADTPLEGRGQRSAGPLGGGIEVEDVLLDPAAFVGRTVRIRGTFKGLFPKREAEIFTIVQGSHTISVLFSALPVDQKALILRESETKGREAVVVGRFQGGKARIMVADSVQIAAGSSGPSQSPSRPPQPPPPLLAQEERTFHRDERYPQTHGLPPAPNEEALSRMTDLGNPQNPLGQVQRNDQARKRLSHAAFTALGRYNHACNDVAFLLTGPKGDHKGEIARRFAELLRLPFIEISPATIRTAHDLFTEFSNGLQRAKLPLVECKGPGHYVIPPCVIFLDDCEGLKQKPTVWPAILQALAITDPTLRTEQGVLVKTIQATWLLATTDRADLRDGLPDRFSELALTPAGNKAVPAPRTASAATASTNTPTRTPSENLKRWKESPHPRAWVEAHKGDWNHADWLSLLEELKKSEFWPLDPGSVGQVLEGLKQANQTQRRPTGVPASPSGPQQVSPRTVPKQSPAAPADQESQPTGAKFCDFCHVSTAIEKRADFVNLEYIWTASCSQCGNQWEYAAGTWVHKGLTTIPATQRKPSSVSRPAVQPAPEAAQKPVPSSQPAAPQAPTPQTIDPASYPMAFVSEGTSFKLTCPCCSREGHNDVQYEKERRESIWTFWRGSWACPHCRQKLFLWKCKHCRSCFFTLHDSPGDLVCCGLPPARVVGRKAERRWFQWIFDPNAIERVGYDFLHDPDGPLAR